MNINLISFGKTMKKLREKLNFTQKDVSTLSGTNTETLRRIENGKVIPKFETLEFLSSVYKEDLNILFLKHRIDDHTYFSYLKNKLEIKFDRDEFCKLDKELKELHLFLHHTNNLFHQNIIRQLILLTESVILYKDNKDYNEAINNLERSMKITTPDFNLNNYKSYIYSSMEIRILMNIAFVLNKLNDKEKYLDIIKFCTYYVDTDDRLYPKLSYNLASAYYRNNDFKKALKYSNQGIKSCQNNRDFNGLNLLYYIKGLSEYKLDKTDYLESLNISLTLCLSFGQEGLRNKIIYNCQKHLAIEL